MKTTKLTKILSSGLVAGSLAFLPAIPANAQIGQQQPGTGVQQTPTQTQDDFGTTTTDTTTTNQDDGFDWGWLGLLGLIGLAGLMGNNNKRDDRVYRDTTVPGESTTGTTTTTNYRR